VRSDNRGLSPLSAAVRSETRRRNGRVQMETKLARGHRNDAKRILKVEGS
jgi:hypothetical protein